MTTYYLVLLISKVKSYWWSLLHLTNSNLLENGRTQLFFIAWHIPAEGVEVDEAGDGRDPGEHVAERHGEQQQVGGAPHVLLHQYHAHQRVRYDGEHHYGWADVAEHWYSEPVNRSNHEKVV